MGQNRITIDSHALIWYMHEDSNVNLSEEAFRAIRTAENNGIIYVSIITLLEIFRVIRKGKYPILFDVLLSKVENSQKFQIIPLDPGLLRLTLKFQDLELHDSIIFATAVMTGTSLVTRDRQIRAKKANVEVIWQSKER